MPVSLRRVMRTMLCVLLLCVLLPRAQADTPVPSEGRLRLRFDDDWRFYREETKAHAGGQTITQWRWKPAPNSRAGDALPADLESGDWRQVRVGQDVFGGRSAFAWFRADLGTVKLPPGAHHVLHFESVDDNGTVYLNGKLLTHHEGWDDAFDVPVDTVWNANGPNTLVILVENTGGGGGIMKPATLEASSAEAAPGYAGPDYNDSRWRRVQLPHDFVVEGTFDRTSDNSHGSLPTGTAWYRKTFSLPRSYQGKSLWIDFDGVYRDSTVWLNGHKLGEAQSGYIGFRYNIAPYVHWEGKNVLAVYVNARKSEGWWYEGGGIYRHVWLNVANPVHVAPWGVAVQSRVTGPDGAASPPADLTITTTVVNDSDQEATFTLASSVLSPDGKVVATLSASQAVPANGKTDIDQTTSLVGARLWSLETPQLYRVHTTITDGRNADSVDTPFGIRTIRFDAEKGFFLNGKPVKIKGTCNHQDFAGVGIGMPDSLLIWRIKKLKEMGSNAYRCSHNPVAPELLDACDRLGMLVMDETRHLGDTYSPKTAHGTGYSDLSDLKSMLLRDRNHPSIIIWSLCNEEGLQGSEEGARIFSAMKEVVHQYDTSRPVSCAMNGGWGYGITNVEDLQGGNYNPGGYDDFHKAHPTMPFYGSETASTVSTRGIYANDKVRGYVSAYDVNYPGWAQTAEDAWRPIAERPYVAGGFVWTGFDYKGEPTPYEWPCINSHFGIMDECGFPKDNYYYYQAWWGDKPLVHLLPHWNWAGKEGQPISVWCHSNCERVELFLNGMSLGSKEMPRYGHLEWSVPYAPGTLEAKGYNGSTLAASDKVETTGPPAALRLTTDQTTLAADGEEVTMVAVAVVDAQGRVVPTADSLVNFTAKGPARVVGVGNGDPSSHEPDRASERHAFNGLCMAVVQADTKKGKVILTATAPGLPPATLELQVIPPAL